MRKVGAVISVTDELLEDMRPMRYVLRRALFPTWLDRIRARLTFNWWLGLGVRFDRYSRWLVLALPFVEVRVVRIGRPRCAYGVIGHDVYYDPCNNFDADEDDED